MSHLLDFLKNNEKFKAAQSLDSLKVTVSQVKHESLQTDIQSPDLRYFLEDGKLVGLHISDPKFDEGDWQIIEKGISEATDLQVIYLSGTLIKSLKFDRLSNLSFINVSENEHLQKIELTALVCLEKLDASFCPNLTSVSLSGAFDKLAMVDVNNGKVKNLMLPSEVKELRCILIKNNPVEKIEWPKKFEKIELIQIDDGVIKDDALSEIVKQTGSELLKSLNAYLGILYADSDAAASTTAQQLPESITKLRRLKILFSGNTTVGKSTLRRILLAKRNLRSAARKEEKSTHGVNVFNEEFEINGEKIFVQGFDFGGQDYYHATHLPFYEHNSLHFILYGYNPNGNPVGNRSAYEFGRKEVEGLEETLFPIDYWLGSVIQGANSNFSFKMEPMFAKKLAGWMFEVNPENDELKNISRFLENEENINALKIQSEKEIKSPKIELVQNIYYPFYFQELNNYSLRNNTNFNVDEIKSFDFHEEFKEVKKLVESKIDEHSKKERHILTVDFKLGKELLESKKVVFDKKSLEKIQLVKENYGDDDALKKALGRLNSHHFGILFEIDENEFYYIADISCFSTWMHKILSKELLKKHNGYIEKTKLKLSSEIKLHFDTLIQYLERQDVIFKVKDENENFLNKWVAPAYLPTVQNRAEELLISNFDDADVKIIFSDFFHSNIVQILIKNFEGNLLFDKQSSEYLMWKNKVILHQENGSKQSALLLIELKYPPNESQKAELHIRRNKSAFIENAMFYEVFDFLMEELKGINVDTLIKTKYGNYIPYSCLLQDNDVGKREKSHLIYHEETFYNRYDFKHIFSGSVHRATKVFIGYSRHDIEYVEELLLHLNPYQKKGEVVVFYDRDLKMGDKWDEELKHQLTTSDLLVCLVSPHMINTDYVVDLEIPLAQKEGLRIAPIVIAECNWQHLEKGNAFEFLGDDNADNKGIPLPADILARHVKWKKIAMEIVKTKTEKDGKN